MTGGERVPIGKVLGEDETPEPEPCRCWVCDSQCGGNASVYSCGPLEVRDGQRVCEWCRSAADVWDADRQGARARAQDGQVRLEADILATFHKRTLRLTPTAARHLAIRLLAAAAAAERQS